MNGSVYLWMDESNEKVNGDSVESKSEIEKQSYMYELYEVISRHKEIERSLFMYLSEFKSKYYNWTSKMGGELTIECVVTINDFS